MVECVLCGEPFPFGSKGCPHCLAIKGELNTMTEQTPPQRAHLDHAHDKHGNPVKPGQLVEFVWAGEHHKGIVHETSLDDHGHHHAHIQITAVVPATACSVRKDENPKAAEKDGSKVEHKPDHNSVRPPTHAPKKDTK
jgi:hypothetical protein